MRSPSPLVLACVCASAITACSKHVDEMFPETPSLAPTLNADGRYSLNIDATNNPCFGPITGVAPNTFAGQSLELSWRANASLFYSASTTPGFVHFRGNFTNPLSPPFARPGCSAVPAFIEGDLNPTNGTGTGTITFADGTTAHLVFTRRL